MPPNTSTNKTAEDAKPAAATPAPQVVNVIMPSAQHAAQQLARELAEQAATGVKLDETTPGGRFLGSDGRYHDAHGRILDDKGAPVDVSAMPFDKVNEELAQLELQRAALLGRVEAARAEALAVGKA